MRVILTCGPSGSGKSTWIQNYLAQQDPHGVVVSADHHFMRNGVYEFRPDQLKTAHSRCFRKFCEAMGNHVGTICVDNTNTTKREREPYITHALANGYEVWLKVLDTPISTCVARNKHGVGEETCTRQWDRMQNLQPGYYQITQVV